MPAESPLRGRAAGRPASDSPLLAEASTIRSFNRETVAGEVLRHLLNVLGSGSVAPGDRLPSERKLAEAFGVGRSAVREAVKSLTLLGLIEVRQGDGMYLSRTSPDALPQVIEWGLILGQSRIFDLVEARLHIEVIVARLAAERVTAEAAAELRDLLDRLGRGVAEQDQAAFIAADLAFHAKISEIANNSVLTGVLHNASSLLQVWVQRVVAASGVRKESYLEHLHVLEAIEKHDGEAAAAAMTEHMKSAGDQLLSSLGSSTDMTTLLGRTAAAPNGLSS